MRSYLQFYIDGQWVDPAEPRPHDVENPATEAVAGQISLGSAADVDRAVKAARRAFASWSQSSRAERLDLMGGIQAEYQKRAADLAAAITEEMGAPASLANGFQVGLGAGHLATAMEILKNFEFEEQKGPTLFVKEPIGVCGMITPWNWPLNQIACKVFPALATGCTMILKPSEIAPFSAQIFSEVMAAAGVGSAISGHPDIDMVSFTGSTRAGVQIAQNAAPSVKRVAQELGGKSANIILDDAAFAENVGKGTGSMFGNSGQTCSAPSRMLVPHTRMDEAMAVAKSVAEATTVGDPNGNYAIGPVVSKAQFEKIQGLIQKGIDEGATLVAGGTGKPEGLEKGHYVKPTVFGNVTNDMTIAREEIFGPVLSILGYSDVDNAIEIANDTEYGLAGYVAGTDRETCMKVARSLHAGWMQINDGFDMNAAFGGYKKSGNGREWGQHGFEEYLELKSIIG